MKAEEIKHTRLLELLSYDSDSGIFTSNVTRGGMVKGDIAGSLHHLGYIHLMVDGVTYPAHRLAWFYCFQEWPEKYIDHIDRNRSNNAIDNLREATREENGANMTIRKDNSTGYKGVSFIRSRNKFRSRITHNKIVYFVGEFNTALEAHIARESKAKELQKEFYNENSSSR